MKNACVHPELVGASVLEEELTPAAGPFEGDGHSNDRLRFGSVFGPGRPSIAEERFRALTAAVIRFLTMWRGAVSSGDLPSSWLSRLLLLWQSSTLVIVTLITRWAGRLTPAGRPSRTEELEAWSGAIASFRHSRAIQQGRS